VYYTSKGAPNPLFVETFALERKVDIFSIARNVDLASNENRTDPKLVALNPGGGTPFLEFDDGTCIAETVTICELMDRAAPGGPKLTGVDLKDQAIISMWLRRVEQHIVLPLFSHYRWGPAKAFFAGRGMHGMLANDAAAEQQFLAAKGQVQWLDDLMVKAGSPEFICCGKVTICDIMLFTQLAFWDVVNGGKIKSDWMPLLKWVPAWFERMSRRPSAAQAKAWNQTHDQSKL